MSAPEVVKKTVPICPNCGSPVSKRLTDGLWDGWSYVCPDCGVFEASPLQLPRRPVLYTEEELVEMVKEAWRKARKLKDGSARATEVRFKLYPYLDYYRRSPLSEGVRSKADEIVEWAVEKGLLKVVKESSWDVPYAYRKHGWRGYKGRVRCMRVRLGDGGEGVGCRTSW